MTSHQPNAPTGHDDGDSGAYGHWTWTESAITKPVLDPKHGDVILIEDDEQTKNGKQNHYQRLMGHVDIFKKGYLGQDLKNKKYISGAP